MIQPRPKYILLYLTGALLLLFGNREFWEKYKQEREEKIYKYKMAKIAVVESNRKFEVQQLVYDSVKKKWKNPNISFVTVNLGKVNFAALKQQGSAKKETNDVENASDSQ
nr:hypothetical protein [uncultured Flavobacterium sp.]